MAEKTPYPSASYPQPTQPASTVPPPPTTYQPGPAPPPGYGQPGPVIIGGQAMFSENPVQMQCPSCRANIVSRTTHKVGLLAWLICGGLCLLGFWLGCQFIPFCINACKDVDHSCPNCNAFLGSHKRI